MQIVIISGLSGAGKSTALKILEDNGYYCVDNLPINLIEELVAQHLRHHLHKVAIGIDSKLIKELDLLPQVMQNLRNLKCDVRLIYLEANHQALITRFSETRRRHPLSTNDNTLDEAIKSERNILSKISIHGERIDTSNLSANNLRSLIKELVDANYSQLNIIIQSFGFKYGLPQDSDFVFDVRCLPNPYYAKNIRDFNGLEEPIINFLEQEPKVIKMFEDIYNFIIEWLKDFAYDNRNYLTIGIGCTGGKHRSVFITEKLAKGLATLNYNVVTRHRQLLD